MINLGIRIRQLREQKGWSQDKLAEEAGISRQVVSNYERNKFNQLVKTCEKIALAFEINLAELFEV